MCGLLLSLEGLACVWSIVCDGIEGGCLLAMVMLQVMDVILRTVRRESPHKTYTDTDLRLSSTCNDCPYNAFVGFQTLPSFHGLPTYKTLWSINM